MSFLFGTPKLPPVPAPEPKPEVTAEDVTKIEEGKRKRARSGRQSTILTSGLGVQDQPLVKRATLGGY